MAKNLSNNQLLLKECINQEYAENELYEDASAYFEFFASSQVLKNYGLCDDEISAGIIGGGNDGGCDGMYVFLNNDLVTQLTVKETILKSQMSIGIEKVPMGIFFDLKSERKSGEEWSCGKKRLAFGKNG